jgi:hypothetical protein
MGNLFSSLDKLFLKVPSLGINLNIHVELCQGLTIASTEIDALLCYHVLIFCGFNQKFIEYLKPQFCSVIFHNIWYILQLDWYIRNFSRQKKRQCPGRGEVT